MKNLQDEVTEILVIRNNPNPIKVYEGIGKVNSNDIAYYLTSLDPDPGNTYVFNIFKIRNEGFLIHLNNGSGIALTNLTNNMYQIEFDIKKKLPAPKEYKVVLFHENRQISKNEARQKFDETPLMEPNMTGKGTIYT